MKRKSINLVCTALALLLSAASPPPAEAANCLAEETGPGSDAYSVSTRTQIFELAENTRQPDLQGHGVLVGHISVVHPNDVALDFRFEGLTPRPWFYPIFRDVRTNVPASREYDHETMPTFTATVRVDAKVWGSERYCTYRRIPIRIDITDVDEPPLQPAAPAVQTVDATSLDVSWSPPPLAEGRASSPHGRHPGRGPRGPDVDSYDLQYREGTSGNWTTGPQNVSGTSAMISGLTANTAYQVQVQATNDEGTSPWSASGRATTMEPPARTYPDLVVEAVVVSYDAPDDEASFALSATGRNAGDGDEAATPVRFHQSTDATITTSDTEVVTDAVGALSAAGTSMKRIDLMVPASASFALSATVRNAGDGDAAATTVRFHQSTDATITTSDTEVATDAVGVLSAAGTSMKRIDLMVPASAGTYYYGACVDVLPDESDKTNNCSSAARVVVPGGGGGGGGGPRRTAPDAPINLMAEATDGAVTLTWDAPEDDGGSAVTDYQYRINRRNPWISIGSTDTTHTVSGLVNGTEYVFEVRAVNRIGKSFSSNRAEATPEAPEVEVFTLDFAHFANGTGITSEMVLVNVAPHPIRPALYFYDQQGHLIDPESVVDLMDDLEVAEDGSLSVLMEMEPLGQLTISTHGRGELVSGSVKVLSDGPIGGGVRYGVPEIGVAGVEASEPVRDVLFPARRQEGGIRTSAALHNLGEEAVGVRCRLMSGGVSLEEVEIPLEANGQASWFIEEAFPTTDTSDFLGSVRCTVLGSRRFTAIAVEMDAARRILNTLSVVPLDRTGGENKQTTLDFAHFVNGTWITDLVFVNLSTEASRPAPTPFHTAIPPSRPAIYFYDTEGALVAPESVVDITGDLEITEDGALTVRTEMEPLGVLTISTHGRGELVSGSVRVVSEGPIGGMLRFEHPALGVAGVGASPPLSDALFPVRRQEGGITTGVALHNLESSPGLLRCDLMREGVLLDAASIPLEANGQTAWLIDQAFPGTDTSDFAGSVRCDAVGEGLFSAVALEMDAVNRIFTTLPVVPVPEMPSRE